ncbi:GntR family transcriptional regulator [Rhodalgimonas zhirmunskyi]|uniref:GntR family transcriptional regulator n=1 Tax=Rhodalgimonas zhirmunskyi TaxID=2964767 RepID=A0AAJ1U5M9_9RHOB|nr:GntR family transcriptional regulator [Rhodoalgimonas zhirmunskyi]MDQ2093479.1 GntR family transcriptional regulator [Rhodoalgimonas zhirmunskyi]
MAGQSDTVLCAILDAIDAGDLLPGDTLDEAHLMAAHGVSRTPVREALIKLDAMGLIQRSPRKGAVVFRPTLEEFLAILEVHIGLEGQAAGLAARRLSPSKRTALEAAVTACEVHAETHGDAHPEAYYQLNLDVHRVIAEATGNPVLLDMIKTNARKLMAYYRAEYHQAGTIAKSALDHREIARLIMARDAAGAEAAMVRHMRLDHMTAMDLLAATG